MEKAERADAAAADDDDDHHCSLSAVQRQPVRNSHDGLNLTCLDQCHGVRSHGTNSRFAQESLPTEAGLCRHQCFSVVAQATQDSPGASPRKNFIEQRAIAEMNAD